MGIVDNSRFRLTGTHWEYIDIHLQRSSDAACHGNWSRGAKSINATCRSTQGDLRFMQVYHHSNLRFMKERWARNTGKPMWWFAEAIFGLRRFRVENIKSTHNTRFCSRLPFWLIAVLCIRHGCLRPKCRWVVRNQMQLKGSQVFRFSPPRRLQWDLLIPLYSHLL